MSPEAYVEMANTEARHWWFAGRRMILSRLVGELHLPVNASILEVGSGTGGNLQMLSAFGHVSAMEMDATARSICLKKTDGRFDVRAGSCPGNIPFDNQKFDLICMFDVLEHIDEDVQTLIALKARLTEGGRILITVPAYRWLWSAHDEFLHHKRRYSSAEFRHKVAIAGFHLARVSHFNTILFPIAALVRLKDKMLANAMPTGGSVPFEPLNQLLKTLFGSERFFLSKVNFPFGVSLLGVLSYERT
jgi:SAM-dependent methyltransferase